MCEDSECFYLKLRTKKKPHKPINYDLITTERGCSIWYCELKDRLVPALLRYYTSRNSTIIDYYNYPVKCCGINMQNK